MYHSLWSHNCTFSNLLLYCLYKKISPFLLLWGSRTERSVKTSYPFFFFFCWIYVGDVNVFVCLCHDFLLPALLYWQIYQMPVIFLHPVFHGFVYCIVKQKKKSYEYWRSCTNTNKTEAEALQLVESLMPVLCFLTIAPGHVIHVICVFIYLSTWNCNDAVDDRSQGELGVDWSRTWHGGTIMLAHLS